MIDGELTGGGGDCLGFADATGEAAVEGGEGVVTAEPTGSRLALIKWWPTYRRYSGTV